MAVEGAPESIRDVWAHFGGLHVPEELSQEVADIYRRGASGRCMMCGREVEDEAIVVVTIQGINQLWCSHKCMQDMNVMGWMSQQYEDMKMAVDFRGNSEP